MTLDYIMTHYGLSEAEARQVTRAQLAECAWLVTTCQIPNNAEARATWLRRIIRDGWKPWGSMSGDEVNATFHLELPTRRP